VEGSAAAKRLKNTNIDQCNTDNDGQAMGEDLRHVQMDRWSKHTGEGSEQQ